MNILQSWQSSLALFKPQSLKLFLLVTLKSIIETYKLLFTTFLPLCGILVALSFLNGWGLLLTILLLCLIIRPSVLKKDYNYLKRYVFHFIYYVIVLLFIMMVEDMFKISVAWFVTCFEYHLALSLLMLIIFFVFLTAPLYIFNIFFYLDSDGRFNSLFKSIVRAIKMVIYSMPFVAIVSIVFLLISIMVTYLIRMIACRYIILFNLFFIMPSMLCFWNNFYIKNIHENFDLYFKRKES